MQSTVKSFQFWPVLVPDFRLLNVSGLHAPLTPRLVTRCELSDGAVGWGEVPCNTGVIRVMQAVGPEVVGTGTAEEEAARTLEQVAARSRTLSAAYALADERGSATFDRGVTNHVRAGVQMALHAAMAEGRGVALCDLLGGERGRRRSEVRFNLYLFFLADTAGSGLDYSYLKPRAPRGEYARLRESVVLDAESAVKLARAGVAELMPGVKLVKWKLGVLAPAAELEVMIAVARELGPEVQVVPDPNAAWDNETAIGFIRELQGAIGGQLPYFEDPVAGRQNMATVHRETGVPLATNMCAANFEQHEDALRQGSIQITLGGDCHYIGGSDEAVRLSRWCAANGMGYAQHSNTHLGISHAHTVQMGAAAETHDWPFDSHYFPWQADYDPTVKAPIGVEHGGICRVPERPGLGVEVNFEGVMELHARYLEANRNWRAYQNRDDGPAAEMVYGGWVRPQHRTKKWFLAGAPGAV
jgi:glucarate dehydratase